MLYQWVATVAKLLLQLRGRFIILGIDHLPKDGGYVITCTHRSWIDVVALGVALLPQQIHFMAKKKNCFNRSF